jgi:hypothetical protein
MMSTKAPTCLGALAGLALLQPSVIVTASWKKKSSAFGQRLPNGPSSEERANAKGPFHAFHLYALATWLF